MKSRYYFDAEQGGEIIRDEQGVEADDVSEVIKQAKLGLEDLREAQNLGGSEGWTLVIRDDKGNRILRLPI